MTISCVEILQMNSQLLLWSWKDADCSLVDHLIAKKLILPTSSLRRTGGSGRNVSKISFFAIKLSTREQSASFHNFAVCIILYYIWQLPLHIILAVQLPLGTNTLAAHAPFVKVPWCVITALKKCLSKATADWGFHLRGCMSILSRQAPHWGESPFHPQSPWNTCMVYVVIIWRYWLSAAVLEYQSIRS